jgi:hypothetical protein
MKKTSPQRHKEHKETNMIPLCSFAVSSLLPKGESMALANSSRHMIERERLSIIQTSLESEGAEFAAWEEVDAGRYMPRRIRGSFRGRELG